MSSMCRYLVLIAMIFFYWMRTPPIFQGWKLGISIFEYRYYRNTEIDFSDFLNTELPKFKLRYYTELPKLKFRYYTELSKFKQSQFRYYTELPIFKLKQFRYYIDILKLAAL